MSLWFVVLITIYTNGDVTSSLVVPISPEYNNEKACAKAGEVFIREEQKKVGTNNGTVFYICQEITAKQIKNATKGGNNL